jgi:hypothetical protein
MKIRTPYNPLALVAWQRDDALLTARTINRLFLVT